MVISPININVALAVLLMAARNNTANEILTALNLKQESNTKKLRETFLGGFGNTYRSLLRDFPMNYEPTFLEYSSIPSVQLCIANRMYMHHKITKPIFENNHERYHHDLELVNFSKDTENIRSRINRWVEEKTERNIKNVIETLAVDTTLLLVNTIYFKGEWRIPFNSRDTKLENFNINANECVTVDMMHVTSFFPYAEISNSQVVELCYGIDGKFSSFIVLPTKYDLSTLERELSVETLISIFETPRRNRKKIILSLPKFKLECSLKLEDLLSSIGICELFDQTSADLSGITGKKPGSKLSVTALTHKAILKVDEKGCEAAGGTVMIARGCDDCEKKSDILFIANHPFLVFIREHCSGCILFWGRVTNPTSEKKRKRRKRRNGKCENNNNYFHK